MVLIKKGLAEFFGEGLRGGIFGLKGRWGKLILTDTFLSMKYAWMFIFGNGEFKLPLTAIKSVNVSRKMDFRYSWLEILYEKQNTSKKILLRFPYSGAKNWKEAIDNQLKRIEK